MLIYFSSKYKDQIVSDEELLDPTTFQADAAAGADVVSQPMQAPDTELVSEDISLDLPEKNKYIESIESIDFSSSDFEKLNNKEKIKLQELAGKQILEEYSSKGVTEFNISEEEIDAKAKELFKEKTKPGLIESYVAQTARGFSSFAKELLIF